MKKIPDQDTMTDIYKLIYSYAINSPILKQSFPGDEIQNFVNTAFVYYIDNTYQSFDETKGKLSTHIYSSLDYLAPFLRNMAIYNTSQTLAKILSHTAKRTSDTYQKVDYMTKFARSIDCINTTLYSNYDDEDNLSYKSDKALSDDGGIPEYEDYVDNEIAYKTYKDCLDRWINKYPPKRHDMLRDIINSRIFGNEEKDRLTLQAIADKYNLTRERIRQIQRDFINYAKNDKELRTALDR